MEITIIPGGCVKDGVQHHCMVCANSRQRRGWCAHEDTARLMLAHGSVSHILEEIQRRVKQGKE